MGGDKDVATSDGLPAMSGEPEDFLRNALASLLPNRPSDRRERGGRGVLRLFAMIRIGIVIGLTTVSNVKAEWSQTPDSSLTLYGGSYPRIISDGSGGVWLLSSTGLLYIDRLGNIPWDAWVRPYLGRQNYYANQLVLADDGDVFVLSRVETDSVHLLVAQRISPDGELHWGDEGVRLDERDSFHYLQNAISDGNNGLLAVYGEFYQQGPGDYDYRPYAIRLSPEGERVWDNRVELGWTGMRVNVRYWWWPPLLSDSKGGLIALDFEWNRIKFCNINLEGERVWGDTTFTLDTNYAYYYTGGGEMWSAASDGEGGFVMLTSFRHSEEHYDGVVAFRINDEGELLWSTVLYERDYRNRPRSPEIFPILTEMSDTCYFAAWTDLRISTKVARIDNDGVSFWDEPVTLCDSLASGYDFCAVAGIDAVNYAFQDTRREGEDSIYYFKGQQISLEGVLSWSEGGIPIETGNQDVVVSTTDSNGGMIIATGPYPIEVNMINKNGELGRVLDEAVYLEELHRSQRVKAVVTIYPQPANAYLTVRIREISHLNKSFSLALFDVCGRTVANYQVNRNHLLTFPLFNLPSGDYFILFESLDVQSAFKFTIQK